MCIRDRFKPTSVEKAIKQFTAPLGPERKRVEWHRFIPRVDSGEWTPAMIVKCPTCGKTLIVNTGGDSAVSQCSVCGFSSTSVHYSMSDLEKHTNRVFVIQVTMLAYLHRRSEEWFGKRLLRTLHCRRCEFVSRFRDTDEIDALDARFGRVRRAPLTGDLEDLVQGGWWIRDGEAYVMGDIAQKLRHGHCPKCCSWHDNNELCRETPLDDGISNIQIILAGLDRFTVSDVDPYELLSERFPDFHYPGISGDLDPRSKVATMVQAAENWWRMD